MNTKTTTYKLFPKQFEFLFGYDKNKVNDIVALYGGVGSGKTFIGSLKGLLMALKFDGIRGLVGAKSQDLLDNRTKRKLEYDSTRMARRQIYVAKNSDNL